MILKRKLRYVLVFCSDNIDSERDGGEILDGIMVVMGHLTYNRANPKIAAQYSERAFAIQVNRGFEKELILALSFVKNMGGKKTGFYTVKTSGAIGKLKKYAESLG